MKRYCYWTVADGDYAEMAKSTVKSARAVGVQNDFHIWSDRPIPGATVHPAGDFDKWGCLFKLTVLRDAVQKLDYDSYVWIDTDTFFVRNPGDLHGLLGDSQFHIAMECDLVSPRNRRPDWWSCPNKTLVGFMREMGITSPSIYNVNGGLFIVRREAVETLFNLAMEFYEYCRARSFRFVDEPLLAYAMHRLCGDVSTHTLDRTHEYWASDWVGEFRDCLPNSKPWWATDYFTGDRKLISPAIVHAMRSKSALIADGKSVAP